MIFLQGFIKFDQGISEKCVGQTFDGRKKEERIIITRYDMIWRIITWLPIPKTMTDINSQEQNLLGNQILPKFEDFFILTAILDSKWSPYGAACLTPFKCPFPLKFLHLWILSNLFLFFLFLYWQPFWNDGHFVLLISIFFWFISFH
jgi:hypothetical protein